MIMVNGLWYGGVTQNVSLICDSLIYEYHSLNYVTVEYEIVLWIESCRPSFKKLIVSTNHSAHEIIIYDYACKYFPVPLYNIIPPSYVTNNLFYECYFLI